MFYQSIDCARLLVLRIEVRHDVAFKGSSQSSLLLLTSWECLALSLMGCCPSVCHSTAVSSHAACVYHALEKKLYNTLCVYNALLLVCVGELYRVVAETTIASLDSSCHAHWAGKLCHLKNQHTQDTKVSLTNWAETETIQLKNWDVIDESLSYWEI